MKLHNIILNSLPCHLVVETVTRYYHINYKFGIQMSQSYISQPRTDTAKITIFKFT